MSSGFVSETELSEIRKRRQEEWDKVRAPDQPAEAPEEPYDSRSLYDRLREQKINKDMQYEEEHKLKNMIRGLDKDEVDYLEMLEKNKNNCQREQKCEVERELKDFRKQVANLKDQDSNNMKTRLEPCKKDKTIASVVVRNTQKALLGLGVKRKNGDLEHTDSMPSSKQKSHISTSHPSQSQGAESLDKGLFKCVAILPGLGSYAESSDSEASTDSAEELSEQLYKEHLDLLGRKPQKKKHVNTSN